MNARLLIPLFAFSVSACNRISTESPASPADPKIIDMGSFNSYRGFAYKEGHRTGIVVACYPDSGSGSVEIWVQEADSATALIEWTAQSGNVSVESPGPGIEKVVLRDVRYERSIGADGAVFPASPVELRLTRIGADSVKLEFLSPSGLPAPLPLQDGSLPLKKDFYLW